MARAVPPGTVTIAGRPFVAAVLPDVYDARDLPYRPLLRPLPDVVDNRAGRRVLTQEGASCTGHALAAVIASARDGLAVSPYMLYRLGRRYDEFAGEEDVGSSLRGVLKGWYHHGVLPEDAWTDPEPDLNDPLVAAEAARIPMGAYYRVTPGNLDDVQSAIAEAGAVCVSALVHEGWREPCPENGAHVIRRLGGHVPLGGHAFALVGYDETGFLVQNSWGPSWAGGGFATLPYDEWLATAYDAFAVRPGVRGTPLSTRSRPAPEVAAAAAGVDLAPYVVNLGNDGRLARIGTFESSPRQIEAALTQMDAAHDKWGGEERHVVLYAHGGLTSGGRGQDIARRDLGWWLANRIYPVTFAWQTGAIETLVDQLADLTRRFLPAGGPAEWLTEQADRAVEVVARGSLAWAWDQMKQNARAASEPVADEVDWTATRSRHPGATLTALALANHLHPGTRVHLVGHSAGSIFLAALAGRLVEAGVPIASTTFLAPAITVADFRRTLGPLLPRLGRFTTFALTDDLELGDVCGAVYRKSILYLVSRAFERPAEAGGEVPILGMAKHLAGLDVPVVLAGTMTPITDHCAARGHSDFDTDTATMTSALLRILGRRALDATLTPYR
ncbi:C1 family peptidase [Herbidospora daliensis]|uniref:C1 family peptidase n=1 Tax=Herbidospora daliensis TaxID=295585 RepID=UPI00078578EF|nr:C1 family peptidase [Herbidospora daliensis]